MDEEQSKDDARVRFSFKREISVGDIIMALAMILPIFYWGTGVETRLSVLQAISTAQVARDNAQDASLVAGLGRIEAKLAEIERYLRENHR